jgi:hypothetical protein
VDFITGSITNSTFFLTDRLGIYTVTINFKNRKPYIISFTANNISVPIIMMKNENDIFLKLIIGEEIPICHKNSWIVDSIDIQHRNA